MTVTSHTTAKAHCTQTRSSINQDRHERRQPCHVDVVEWHVSEDSALQTPIDSSAFRLLEQEAYMRASGCLFRKTRPQSERATTSPSKMRSTRQRTKPSCASLPSATTLSARPAQPGRPRAGVATNPSYCATEHSGGASEEEIESEPTDARESTSGVYSALSGSRRSLSVASRETKSSVSATTGGTRSSISAASGVISSFVSSIAQPPRGGAPTPPPSGITNPYQLNLPTRSRRKSFALLSDTSRSMTLTSVAEEDENSEYDDGQTESLTARSSSTVTERPRRSHDPTTDVLRGKRH